MTVIVRSPAKVNVQLSVGPVRTDGYHELVTVFQAVSLHDVVTAREGDGVSLTMEGEGSESLPIDDSNLAVRAAMLLAEHADVEPNVRLHIEKSIPIAGGMAGGSADAAGVLVACDALWQTGLSRDDLATVGAHLGSDVPFALFGGNAIGRGRGEQIMPVLGRGQFHWVFAFADEGLSTPAVYRQCDALRGDAPVPEPYVSDLLLQALRAGDPEVLADVLHNDLQPAAISMRPSLRTLLEAGVEYGALAGIVSGSGPTCAFLVRDDEHALDVAVALTATGNCRTVKRGTGPAPGARVI
jgi:4-diphosphocytidyl-2-C-methyl-D-erythritol kinase